MCSSSGTQWGSELGLCPTVPASKAFCLPHFLLSHLGQNFSSHRNEYGFGVSLSLRVKNRDADPSLGDSCTAPCPCQRWCLSLLQEVCEELLLKQTGLIRVLFTFSMPFLKDEDSNDASVVGLWGLSDVIFTLPHPQHAVHANWASHVSALMGSEMSQVVSDLKETNPAQIKPSIWESRSKTNREAKT